MAFRAVHFEQELKDGDVPLCLTPEVLLILNHGFDQLSNDTLNNNKNDLDYLKTALDSTRYLRLSHGGNSTIQAPVDLTAFHSLSQLDVKKIPPHWIVGLNKLQDKLTFIRMSRSINNLEDLLTRSAADSHAGSCFTWSRLKRLYLSNNFIKSLDESLKMLPVLEVLDLSQNYLRHTQHHLTVLTELTHINLAYNSLSSVPAFSSFSQLKTLVLKANNLENIQGVELLENLETLDISCNILCDHGALYPLKNLFCLTHLYVADNPLSNNPKHRVLTGAIMDPKVLLQLTLDGEPFHDSEIKAITILLASLRPCPKAVRESRVDIVTVNADKVTSPVKGGKLKTNDVSDIPDMSPQPDDGEEGVSPSPSDDVVDADVHPANQLTSGKINSHLTKRKVVSLREEFGDSWLRSFNGYLPSKQTYQQQNGNVAEEKKSLSEPIKPDAVQEPVSQYGSPDEGSVDMHIEEPVSYYGSVVNDSETRDDNSSVFSAEEYHSNTEESHYDPFIVKLANSDSGEFLIMINDYHIIEKNIQGIITELLDLSALLQVHILHKTEKIIVECKFDYFRKDRRERLYEMEDQNDASRLLSILQPIAERTQANKMSTDTMECLKCGKRYEKIRQKRKGARSDCCPSCKSDMVIELSSQNILRTSTPVGSPILSPSFPTKMMASKQKNGSESGNESSVYVSFSNSLAENHNTSPRKRSKSDEKHNDWPPSTPPNPFDDADEENEVDNHLSGGPVKASPAADTLSYTSLSNVSDTSSSIGNDEHLVVHHFMKDPLTGFKYDPEDMTYIDHRLKLHLTVSYFDDSEQPQCVLRCKCVTYGKPEEYPALLVITNKNVFIFRVHARLNGIETGGPVFDLLEKALFTSMYFIEIGLDHNSIRIEFEKFGYCFLLRDGNTGRALHAKLSELMSEEAFEETKLQAINKINQDYILQISRCVSLDEDNLSAAKYLTAFMRTENSYDTDRLIGCQPITMVVDDSHLFLLKEFFHLPFTRGRLAKKQKYMHLESQIAICDISSLTVCQSRYEVDVQGFEEQKSDALLRLVFVSLYSMKHFISFLHAPWKGLYGVELQINITD